MRPRVLILCPQLQVTLDRYRGLFEERGVDLDVPPVVQGMKAAELLAIIDRYDGVIAGDDEFSAAVLEKGAAARLKVVSKWGVGVDAIDLEAAGRLGLPVTNTPNVFGDEVADVVVGYLVLLARQLHKLDAAVRAGVWLKIPGMSLRGKTLGVIGVGSIGQAVVRRGLAMGMNVVGYDLRVPEGIEQQLPGLRIAPFDEVIAGADFITLNCNLTPENRHMLAAPQFAMMKDGVRIINTSRGPLIHEAALVEALRSGKVAGAALDVFEEEPLPAESPLRGFDQCIFGTHNSSNTLDAVLRVNERAIANLLEKLGLGAGL
ncbi:MAG: phosphoglycerate dehydrogenase [Chloroflexi bacterium]|nr:phosphoglycerate dehydrogenase [Chloroflexota bacterium]